MYPIRMDIILSIDVLMWPVKAKRFAPSWIKVIVVDEK